MAAVGYHQPNGCNGRAACGVAAKGCNRRTTRKYGGSRLSASSMAAVVGQPAVWLQKAAAGGQPEVWRQQYGCSKLEPSSVKGWQPAVRLNLLPVSSMASEGGQAALWLQNAGSHLYGYRKLPASNTASNSTAMTGCAATAGWHPTIWLRQFRSHQYGYSRQVATPVRLQQAGSQQYG